MNSVRSFFAASWDILNEDMKSAPVHRSGGYGYLRRTIAGWNEAARGGPWLVLTDLDRAECPRALIDEWLPQPQHPNLLFRVAVREVEAWLLADRENLARYLGVSTRLFPPDPDSLPDAKRSLIELARRSRGRAVRESIVPRQGSTAKQGGDYNGFLGRFVMDAWNIKAASVRSPSVDRTIAVLARFEPIWE
jgi:hypothetical protein